MGLEVITVQHSKVLSDSPSDRERLIWRVASSATFEKSPRLRAFLLHVCKCALEKKPEEATEQQIGIYVYGRSPGYNPNDDNIVRSQARVLRMKLEHHFANEGKGEEVVIRIPKGQYLPTFEARSSELQPAHIPAAPSVIEPKPHRNPRWLGLGAIVLGGIALLWLVSLALKPKANDLSTASILGGDRAPDTNPSPSPVNGDPLAAPSAELGGVRIAAGRMGAAYADQVGQQWEADRYFKGGTAKPGPLHLFPPVADEDRFKSIREAESGSTMVPQSEREFRYDIPASPGVYELRLYFADPQRQRDQDRLDDGQNDRVFHIDLNGTPLLARLDPVADAGSAAVDIRTFKDVTPASDGVIHLAFHSDMGKAFVSALELTPGLAGKLRPIRIAVRKSGFADADGTRWSGDSFFIDGRSWAYENPQIGPHVPALYLGERYGNFSYSVPVPPGSYTVRLHFLESFFSPLIPAATCHGVGCRVFDVMCNGVMLLQDFDVTQAAGGAFRPVTREFHGLHPNGQGKLLLSFSPKVNYAEVRAIEVLDEGK